MHKQGNPGRPFVSSNSHPTERISQFVDHHLKPLVQTTQSFIKDTTHFLNKLEQLGQLPPNALLVTLDVSSVYTNIPHNEGITACRHFLDTRDRNRSTVGTETLCDLNVWFLPWTTLPSTTDTTYTDTRYSRGNQNGTFLYQPVPRQIWDRRFVTCSIPTTHMVALHRRYLHDMDTFCWRPSCFHLLP